MDNMTKFRQNLPPGSHTVTGVYISILRCPWSIPCRQYLDPTLGKFCPIYRLHLCQVLGFTFFPYLFYSFPGLEFHVCFKADGICDLFLLFPLVYRCLLHLDLWPKSGILRPDTVWKVHCFPLVVGRGFPSNSLPLLFFRLVSGSRLRSHQLAKAQDAANRSAWMWRKYQGMACWTTHT